MRIALSMAIAFSIATGAGTYAYLDAKTTFDPLRPSARSERAWHSGTGGAPEIALPSKAP